MLLPFELKLGGGPMPIGGGTKPGGGGTKPGGGVGMPMCPMCPREGSASALSRLSVEMAHHDRSEPEAPRDRILRAGPAAAAAGKEEDLGRQSDQAAQRKMVAVSLVADAHDFRAVPGSFRR